MSHFYFEPIRSRLLKKYAEVAPTVYKAVSFLSIFLFCLIWTKSAPVLTDRSIFFVDHSQGPVLPIRNGFTDYQLGKIEPFFEKDSQRRRSFASLLDIVARKGRVQVIVGLRVKFEPEGFLANAQKRDQQVQIKGAQERLINRLQSSALSGIKRFDLIPYVAFEVDLQTLESLERDGEVVSIQEDVLSSVTLAESSYQVGAHYTWDQGYAGFGQTIAVLDTGVYRSHGFLNGKVISEACYSSNDSGAASLCPGGATSSTAVGSGANCDLGSANSSCSHGTHVAGIAAGKGPVALSGMNGIARDATLLSIQVFSKFFTSADCGQEATPCIRSRRSDQILALQRVQMLSGSIRFAAVNMSLGGSGYTSNCDSQEAAIKSAIDNLRSINVATIISSGNDGFTNAISAPACVSSAISVGSVGDGSGGTIADRVSSFSNSASFLSLLAPGAAINSSIPPLGSDTDFYAVRSGTSQAAPHVAGAWAVLRQAGPNLTVSQILNGLTSSGLSITDSRNGIVKSRIRLLEALVSVPVSVTIGAQPGSPYPANTTQFPTFMVDGVTYNGQRTFNWLLGSSHTIGAASPQTVNQSERWNFSQWSNSGAQSHTVTASPNFPPLTATFLYEAKMTVSAGSGTVTSPTGSAYYPIFSSVDLLATPGCGLAFTGWTGTGSGSYTGPDNPATVTIFGPITELGSSTSSGNDEWFVPSAGGGATGGAVFATAADLSGNIYAGGSFTTIGGVAASRIAKWNGTNWSALGSGTDIGSIRGIAISGTDLYAVGAFSSVGGVTANNVAKWNGTSWSALGSGTNGVINAIAVSGSTVYVGGQFTTAGGVTANRIARWNGGSWSALGTGMDGNVNSIAISGSDIYAGGSFTAAGGVAANRIARWNGASWTGLSSGLGQQVNAIAISGSNIYAGGLFTTAGGLSANRIAKWNGTSWAPIGSGVNGSVNSISVSDGGLNLGGNFAAGGGRGHGLAKWNGSTWTTTGFDREFFTITTSGSRLYAGGLFSNPVACRSTGLVGRYFETGRSMFDYDGDGRSDLSVRRSSNNTWYLLRGTAGYTAMQFGEAEDRMAPADFDGDGKTDVAVFRPSTGTWFVFASQTQTFQQFGWGANGDLPVPTDRDNDGKADLVVYRESNNTWYTRFANGTFATTQFGVTGDKPLVGDFDGDGVGDIALFRPSNNNWYLIKSSLGFFIQTWGESGDIPVPADYDGDGATDQAVFRPSTGQWFLSRTTAGFGSQSWGQAGDIPVAADYDGDGKADVAVFRPSNGNWYIVNSTAGQLIQQFGTTGDIPTPRAFLY